MFVEDVMDMDGKLEACDENDSSERVVADEAIFPMKIKLVYSKNWLLVISPILVVKAQAAVDDNQIRSDILSIRASTWFSWKNRWLVHSSYAGLSIVRSYGLVWAR